jgi:hypothetical protein
LEDAKKILKDLEELEKKSESKIVTHSYSIQKGYILKFSGRTRDRAEAERFFKSVIEDDPSSMPNNTSRTQYLSMSLFALYELCDLYLEELEMSNNLKIIKDINPLISRLFRYANQFNSNLLLTEVKVFQAKLELIQLKFDNAKRLLIEAQDLAELKKNQRFARTISYEHDRLIEQRELWENLKMTEAPFSERIKLASFDGILDRIQGKRSEKAPEMINEQPVLLLILAEGGVLIFSYPFTDEWKYDTEIFSSFLSAFTSFSDEFFSKGLDRVKFGDDTLLLQTVVPFSIGYLYKGQTYPAKLKLTTFIKKIQELSSIWQTLDKFSKASQVAELKDVPQIEQLIKDIFVK